MRCQEDRCFSVVAQNEYATDVVDLIAPTMEVKRTWVRGLQLLIKRISEDNLAEQQNRYRSLTSTLRTHSTCVPRLTSGVVGLLCIATL